MNIRSKIFRYSGLAFVLVLVGSACSEDKNHPGYEFMPNMYRSAGYETYSESSVTSNGMSAMTPVEGTIPRGFVPYEFGGSIEEYERAGAEMVMPAELITEEALAEGKELYIMFCMHCHGPKGAGDGVIIKNENFPAPPSYADGNSSRGGAMSDLSVGKIYHTIMYGLNMMGSHASQLTEEERWKIVLYVQELQGKNVLGAPEETEETETADEEATVVAEADAEESEVQQEETAQ